MSRTLAFVAVRLCTRVSCCTLLDILVAWIYCTTSVSYISFRIELISCNWFWTWFWHVCRWLRANITRWCNGLAWWYIRGIIIAIELKQKKKKSRSIKTFELSSVTGIYKTREGIRERWGFSHNFFKLNYTTLSLANDFVHYKITPL